MGGYGERIKDPDEVAAAIERGVKKPRGHASAA
jgi:hypothetical protein